LRDQGRKDFLLSLAYSSAGDLESARRVLPSKVVPSGLVRRLSGDWFSSLQYNAQYLLALAAADPRSPDIPVLIKEFGKNIRSGGHFGSTHDNAWALMGLARAVSERGKLDPLTAEWGVEGGAPKSLNGETAVVQDRTLSGKKLFVLNNGDRPIYYHLMAEGTKLAGKKESESNGLSVSREYRDENGNLLNLGSVTQGGILVVTLRLKAVRPLDNVVIVDLLPAGFEVDNPRLNSRGNLGFTCECSLEPAYRDFRDDRVLLFTRAFEGEQTFSYSVRAVTPGKYAVPSLLAEAMYDPDVYARSGGGETLVVAPFKP
jgi:alpha-2-macroglobulin